MSEAQEWTLADETASSLLAHQALTHALFTSLEQRGLLSKADINDIYNQAMIALETAEPQGAFIPRARQILERTATNLTDRKR